MSKVIDRKIEKEISTGLKLNRAINQPLNTYVLPRFDKNDKGEYIFVGNCTITSISEFNKYMRTYREIANSLRKTYRPVIAKIYKNALNSLVADNSKFRITDNDFSLVSKFDTKDMQTNSYIPICIAKGSVYVLVILSEVIKSCSTESQCCNTMLIVLPSEEMIEES